MITSHDKKNNVIITCNSLGNKVGVCGYKISVIKSNIDLNQVNKPNLVNAKSILFGIKCLLILVRKKKTVTTDHTQSMICGQRLLPCRNDVAGRKELPYNPAYSGRSFFFND